MDSLVFVIIGQAVGIILAVIAFTAGLIFLSSKFTTKSTGKKSRSLLVACICVSIVTVGLLSSVVLVGQSFFNNPQFSESGITTTTWPYDLERILLGTFMVTTIILWINYLRHNK